MKQLPIAILFVAIAAIVSAETQPPPFGVTFAGKVVRVVDGDTIDVEVRKVVRVRLLDCWAPETRTTDAEEKALGLAAKATMVDLSDGKRVKVFVPTDPDAKLGDAFSFGRALGHVWVDGDNKSLSEQMVESGHATREKRR